MNSQRIAAPTEELPKDVADLAAAVAACQPNTGRGWSR